MCLTLKFNRQYNNQIAILFILANYFCSDCFGQTRRCFSFTWLGPRYNNESVFLNATCDDATNLASGVPCFQPLVVSYDGTRPDTSYIWTWHADEATCMISDNDVCATYEYYFNGNVENSTHMCTRVSDSLGNIITSGCYTETNGNYKTRVCFCRSLPGGVPCNLANRNNIRLFVIFILGVSTLLYLYILK